MPERDPYLEHLLGENEEIILAVRQHWFVLLRSILVEGFLILVISALVTVLLIFFLPNTPIWLGYLLLLPPIISMIWDIIVWWNRKYIITSRRVIQIFGVINKDVIDSSLEKVNDVRMTQSFFGRIFGYGDVEIMTASELGVNKIKRLGDPVRFKTSMINAKEKLGTSDDYFRAQQGYAMPPAAPNIPEMIAQLDAMRKAGTLTEEEFQQMKAKLISKM